MYVKYIGYKIDKIRTTTQNQSLFKMDIVIMAYIILLYYPHNQMIEAGGSRG